mmetsp:Transcript_11997/g.44586  ORF Transcript_11997/g.44586 Transcript_11997/m.44586 type:complete len:200 (+) Transcript_11997:523-1122(+)
MAGAAHVTVEGSVPRQGRSIVVQLLVVRLEIGPLQVQAERWRDVEIHLPVLHGRRDFVKVALSSSRLYDHGHHLSNLMQQEALAHQSDTNPLDAVLPVWQERVRHVHVHDVPPTSSEILHSFRNRVVVEAVRPGERRHRCSQLFHHLRGGAILEQGLGHLCLELLGRDVVAFPHRIFQICRDAAGRVFRVVCLFGRFCF